MDKFYTYILKSKKDGSLYIGYTSDLEKRLVYHNSGSSKFTSKKTPWEIVYFEEFNTKSEAIKREVFLKKQKKRDFYNRLINS